MEAPKTRDPSPGHAANAAAPSPPAQPAVSGAYLAGLPRPSRAWPLSVSATRPPLVLSGETWEGGLGQGCPLPAFLERGDPKVLRGIRLSCTLES